MTEKLADMQKVEEGVGNGTKRLRPQIVATIIGTLPMLACGLVFAWPTPSLPKLQEKSSPLHLTSDEGAWVVTALPIGALFGPILSALLLDLIGRKWFLYLTSVPFLICWVLTFVAGSWIELFVGRLFGGASIGALCAMVPIYLGEIVETKIRGASSTMMALLLNIGFMIEYIVGPQVDGKILVIICAIPTIVFMLTFLWMPESPYYYLQKGNRKGAELALKSLRGTNDNTNELNEMSAFVKEQQNGSLKELFTDRAHRKALLIVLLLMTGQQISGLIAIQSYAGLLFQNVTSSISTNMALIILGGVALIASIASAFIVDMFGRKPLYLISAFVCTLCLGIVASYFLLEKLNMDVKSFSWVPLVALVVYFGSHSLGLAPIPFVVSSEIFPVTVKSLATTIITTYGSVLGIIVAKCYQIVIDAAGFHTMFYGFALSTLVVGIVAAVAMPETSRKSFADIQMILHKQAAHKLPKDKEAGSE
ncbi:facilitated trehalose transporter Tret1-like [Andrena cerasifolii]|uniref:facilitated trehalose transporter Tret1-like n=1 Tax=Andrena cerasifolii TaxID=2819439 RepID=UPI004038238C